MAPVPGGASAASGQAGAATAIVCCSSCPGRPSCALAMLAGPSVCYLICILARPFYQVSGLLGRNPLLFPTLPDTF